ncbi:MAG: hypothetical protein KDA57_09625 [Planctomycetales bacterium]|nr:hypothetical protein [Planctomycetales bacterium]
MKNSRFASRVATQAIALLVSLTASAGGFAHETGQSHLHFQQPSQAAQGSRANDSNVKFRSPTAERPAAKKASAPKREAVERASYDQPAEAKARKVARVAKQRVETSAAETGSALRAKQTVSRDRQVVRVAEEMVIEPEPELVDEGPMVFDEGCACQGDCACDMGCELGSPGCGYFEPGCGCAEPGCGICEPGCGFAEPSCGLEVPGCGSCVGRPGPDYWCFPVCLPRFKDLSFWGGVQGFRGPRDFAPGQQEEERSDSNFGFHEGINISGRAPLIGLVFPQLSYQLGYQGVQSRLSGTTTSAADRSQQFVTAGFFRRVHTGLQFGVVWDMLRDDLDMEVDYHQIRTEFSLKSPQGREFGFFSTSATNSNEIFGITYETVDQYALFYRWNFGKNYECRFWGGVTGNDEGLFGGEFYAPLSDRWTVQSGFNYLITDKNAGLEGVREEAWNIGINLVWHLGRTARRGCQSPYRPLFPVADNGWMIVDNVTPWP